MLCGTDSFGLDIAYAVMLVHQGKTLLIDGDPQASDASWAAWRRETQYTRHPPHASLVKRSWPKASNWPPVLSTSLLMRAAVIP